MALEHRGARRQGSASRPWREMLQDTAHELRDRVEDEHARIRSDLELASIVHENLPLILEALSSYAKQTHTDGLALENAAANGKDEARQQRKGLDMMNEAAQARSLEKELSSWLPPAPRG